jgi:hypothetical protein
LVGCLIVWFGLVGLVGLVCRQKHNFAEAGMCLIRYIQVLIENMEDRDFAEDVDIGRSFDALTSKPWAPIDRTTAHNLSQERFEDKESSVFTRTTLVRVSELNFGEIPEINHSL